jgi:hypothetical protein
MIHDLEPVEATVQSGLYAVPELEGVGNFATNSGIARTFTSPNSSRTYQSYVATTGESIVKVGESSVSTGYGIAALY